jgi:hypothetical protein
MSIESCGRSKWEGALVVKPKTAWEMLSCSNAHGYHLLNSGELESFHDGRSRKITVASIKALIERKLAESRANPQAKRRGRPRKVQVVAQAEGASA